MIEAINLLSISENGAIPAKRWLQGLELESETDQSKSKFLLMWTPGQMKSKSVLVLLDLVQRRS
jgi:hypothetical protein